MQTLVLVILGWIALTDARTHRIPNRQLLILGIASLITTDPRSFSFHDHFYLTLIVLSVAVVLSIFCGLGMGDVKLLGVLTMFVLPPQADIHMIFLLTVALTASAHAIFLSEGDLRKSLRVPLAPAIFLGTIIALVVK